MFYALSNACYALNFQLLTFNIYPDIIFRMNAFVTDSFDTFSDLNK